MADQIESQEVSATLGKDSLHQALIAGVAAHGLYESADGAATWTPLPASGNARGKRPFSIYLARVSTGTATRSIAGLPR